MIRQEATEQYAKALKAAQKEFKDRQAKGLDPYPAVLDEILADSAADSGVYIGLVEIPVERIVGIRSKGRTSAFTAGFLPLLDPDTEFAAKWISLCEAHLSEEGIRDPIECVEYLGDFYLVEGNKRVSVLKQYGAARIPGTVQRIMPAPDDSPRIKAYMEFIEFYKCSGIYNVKFTQPGCYTRLTAAVGIPAGQEWSEDDRKRFHSYFHYFREAFASLGGDGLNVQPEDALLLWLKLYSYEDLGTLSSSELKKSLHSMWSNVAALDTPAPEVITAPAENKASILTRFIAPDHVNVAFIHQRTVSESRWTAAHEMGRLHLEEALGKAVTTRVYFNANTNAQAEEILEKAVADGAEVIFTTSSQLSAPSLKASIRHPKLRFLNCAVNIPYSTVRSYYGRVYEGKFITGAIAGAMCRDGRIGFVGAYPIYGIGASINAFALGAQMTNPNAEIYLKWSCLPGNPTREFLRDGIRVISNRDTPVEDQLYTEFGTYMADEDSKMISLGAPFWVWGNFYENVIRSILDGTWDTEKGGKAVNYWWGMSSGIIDVKLSKDLPEGVKTLACYLRKGLREKTLDPFARKIIDQEGNVRNDGTQVFTPETLLKMDWLCENVHGSIPSYDQLLPYSRATVRVLGLHPEEIPAEEVTL